MFPLELKARLYYSSITIISENAPAQMSYKREALIGNENQFWSKSQLMNFEIW